MDHDSYVELQQLVRHMAYEIARVERVGAMSIEQARLLVAAVQAAETLSADQKHLIAERLLK